MTKLISYLPALSAVCTAALLYLALPTAAAAAEKDNGAEASAPKDGAGDTAKDDGEPDEASSPDAEAENAPPAGAGEIQSAVKLKDILGEGFLIRTTLLVPTEAVTRQLGKVSPDAIILTLQRETAIAVCYYTLKAYVKESLTDIASCTVFR